MTVHLNTRSVGGGFEYTEIIESGVVGETIIIPPFRKDSPVITCTMIAGANTGKFQFTTSPDASVLAGTANWMDWPKGDVTGTDYDAITAPITGLRGVSVSGQITIEIVR